MLERFLDTVYVNDQCLWDAGLVQVFMVWLVHYLIVNEMGINYQAV